MKDLTIAPADRQITLISVPPSFNITKNAHARNAYGQVAQEIVCAALEARPVKINGKFDVCFDAIAGNSYIEIKSVKRKGKVVVYDWRRNKERQVMLRGYNVNYAILIHGVRCSNGKNLLDEFVRSNLTLFVVDARSVHEMCAELPLHTIKKVTYGSKRFGYNREGYIEGYRNVPVERLIARYSYESYPKVVHCCGRSFNITITV